MAITPIYRCALGVKQAILVLFSRAICGREAIFIPSRWKPALRVSCPAASRIAQADDRAPEEGQRQQPPHVESRPVAAPHLEPVGNGKSRRLQPTAAFWRTSPVPDPTGNACLAERPVLAHCCRPAIFSRPKLPRRPLVRGSILGPPGRGGPGRPYFPGSSNRLAAFRDILCVAAGRHGERPQSGRMLAARRSQHSPPPASAN